MSTPVGPAQPPLFPGFRSIKENWGWYLTIGILLVILGTIAAGAAVYTTLFTIFFLGTLLIIGGAAKTLYSFWEKNWGGFFLSLLVGLLYLVTGIIFLFKPGQAAAALTLIIGSLFLVSGLFKIIAALTARFEHWGWILFSGIVSLILGLLVLGEWPLASMWIIGLFVGIDLIIYGWLSILFAITAKNAKI